MYLYLIRNTVNGKGYVGITSHKLSGRIQAHYRSAERGGRGALAKAIRKYGRAAFTVTQLAEATSWDELVQMEQAAIATYNTFAVTGHGYNLTLGGEGILGFKRPEMAEAQRGEKNNRYGKGMEASLKQKLIAFHTGRVKSAEEREKLRAANVGKTLSEAHKQKVR